MDGHEHERLGLEKRKYVRIKVELQVKFKIEGDREKKVYKAFTRDISHGGLGLKIKDEKQEILEKIGDIMPKLEVEIDLVEKKEFLNVYTKTAWISSKIDWIVRPPDGDAPLLMGMAFENLSVSDEEKINSYIAELLIKKRATDFS